MKKHMLMLLSLLISFTMISCTGNTGSTGPQGPAGDPSLGILSMTFQNGSFPYSGYFGW